MRQKGWSADPCCPEAERCCYVPNFLLACIRRIFNAVLSERKNILQSYENFTVQKGISMIYLFLLLPLSDMGMHAVRVPTLECGNQMEKNEGAVR